MTASSFALTVFPGHSDEGLTVMAPELGLTQDGTDENLNLLPVEIKDLSASGHQHSVLSDQAEVPECA